MSSLRFRSIAVRRLPGIDDGGFELKDLSPGVNVIYGPNGIGKTSTARALEALLWPARSPDPSAWVVGSFDLGDARWAVELDAGRSRLQRDGEPAGSPHALPTEAAGRYRLELKELLAVEDQGLARAIGLESAGGYDLAEAGKALSARRTVSRPKREADALKAAVAKLREARAIQERLQDEARQLEKDEARLARKPMLASRLGYLRIAAEHAELRRSAADARAKLGDYHPVLERLVGDEANRCAEIQSRLADALERGRTAAEVVAAKRVEIDRLALPAALVGRDQLSMLASRLVELERLEAEIRAEERGEAEAIATVKRESERLGGIAAEDVGRVTLAEVSELAARARALEAAEARRLALEAEVLLLTPAPDTVDGARLERAIFLLQQWLRTPDPGATDGRLARGVAIAASILLLVGGAALAILHPLALLLSAAGAILLSMILRRRIDDGGRPIYEADYATIGLDEAPAAWRPDEVRACVESLIDRLVNARSAEEMERRARKLEPQLLSARAEEAELRTGLTGAAEELGLGSVPTATLHWFLDRLTRMQTAVVALEAASAGRERGLAQREGELARANEILVLLGSEAVGDTAALRGTLRSLEEKVSRHTRARAELERSQGELESATRRSDELRSEFGALLLRLGIAENEADRLADWCAERQGFLDARREADSLASATERLRQKLLQEPSFDPEILDRPTIEIEQEAAGLLTEIAELDEVQKGVVRVRAEIERAMRGHEVEDALAELESCVAALRDARDRDARATIAAILVEHVERRSRNEQRPEVFHRASALFSRITRGRYELMLDERQGAAFRAFDTQRERSHTLDELSSATRLQLLLAVRVAFVETHEGGVRLPLLMDETLANSDETRGAAIMDAVIALAAEGRQIFYFTAQPDEVEKWRDALAGAAGVGGGLFDLAEARGLGRRLDPARLEGLSKPRALPPSPDGRSHTEYGVLLGIPRVDPLEAVGALHLWYLVEDPAELHRIVALTGADRWGNVRSLLEGPGGRLLPESTARRLEALAECASAALAGLRVGRGRPVDRQALAESRAVSDRFLDEVHALARDVGGDAARLIDALDRKAVAKFQQRNILALRDFLEERGYLDARQPMRAEEVRHEVLIESVRSREAGLVSVEEIDRLLTRLSGASETEVEYELDLRFSADASA